MKNKKRMRSLMGMTLLAGIGAAVIWYIDPAGVNRLPWLPSEQTQDTFVTSMPITEDAVGEESFGDAPEQSEPGEAAEPAPFQDVAFEPEVLDVGEEPVPVADAAVVGLFEPAISETPDVVAPELAGHRVAVEEEPIVPAAGTDEDVQPPATDSAITAEKLAAIDRMIDDGEEIAAHQRLSAWYWNHPQDRPRFQKSLEALAESIYFSPQPHYTEAYVIQPGDQLRKIAAGYKISWQYLARLNQVNPRKIRIGQKLKVVEGPFDAVVDLSDYQLTILCHGQYVRQYHVGIGKDGSSPVGKFTVKDKLENPVYYGPDGVIDADDPTNPLGERWIDIGDSFGIHGTIDPESIGKNESRGCIRMLNDDVAEVYDFLTVGSTVWIRR